MGQIKSLWRRWRIARENEKRRFWRRMLCLGLQFRVSGYFVFTLISILVVVNLVSIIFFIDLINIGNSHKPGADVFIIIKQAAEQNYGPLAIGVSVIFCGLWAFAIRVTHNVAGPAYALGRHIDELISGNFTHRTRLRKDDELKALRDRLNHLSEILEKKIDASVLEGEIKAVEQ